MTQSETESHVVFCLKCGEIFCTRLITSVCRECADSFVKEQGKKEKKRIKKCQSK